MNQLQKRSKKKLMIAFSASLITLILSSVLSYYSIAQLNDSQHWVDHTLLVESNLQNLISKMKDAETGQRGYLLTDDESFLEPLQGSKEDVQTLYEDTELLTKDNAEQQSEFPRLRKLIDQKFEIINSTIAARKNKQSLHISTLKQGKAIMDSIRTLTTTMVGREKLLLKQRDHRLNAFIKYTTNFIALGALLAMVITLISYYMASREAAEGYKTYLILQDKEQKVQKQIKIIEEAADRIAAGNFDVRIKPSDLE